MKISCVVLNYNDADTTISQMRRVSGYSNVDFVVVADNCSGDDSLDRIRRAAGDSPKIRVLALRSNGGYGSGNNAGVRYCAETLHSTHVIIANPDTEFSEDCVDKMAQAFERYPGAGIVAARMTDGSGGGQACAWPLLPFFKHLLAMGPVCRRVFKRALGYPPEYLSRGKAAAVGAVHGSMLMVDAARFREAGGYDENVFLYEEENILGQRMKRAGFRTLLLPETTYYHQDSATTKKVYSSLLSRQKLRHESTMYYYKRYLRINRLEELTARVFFRVILLEIRVFGAVFKRKR